MTASEHPVQTGPGEESGNLKTLDIAWFILGDIHTGAGKTIEVRQHRTIRFRLAQLLHLAIVGLLRLIGRRADIAPPPETVPIKNPLEDFPHDGYFVGFVRAVIAMCGHATQVIGIKLMGDCFDALAVTIDGVFGKPRTQKNGAKKIRRIIAGHPQFFDILAEFIRLPNGYLDIFTGNHDSFLNWPLVRKLIVRRLAGNDQELAKRIRFIGYEERYQLIEGEAYFDHAMNAERHTALDPDKPFVTERYGRKLVEPELNEPVGNLMTEELANAIKLDNQNVSLLEDAHTWDEAWRTAKYGWAARSLGRLAAFYAHRFHEGLANIVAAVVSTMPKPKPIKDPVLAYAEKKLREFRSQVRAVFVAHSHKPSRTTFEEGGTVINVGSPARQRRLVWPAVADSPEKRHWYGEGWRGLTHHLYSSKTPFGLTVSLLLLYAMIAALLVSFLFMPLGKTLTLSIIFAKGFAFVTLAFLCFKGLARFFMVKPEVVEYVRFTCGLQRRYSDGMMLADLMCYDTEQQIIREMV